MSKLKSISTILCSLLIIAKYTHSSDVYSTCYKSTKWTKNFGDEIKSWIRSIVPSISPYKMNINVTFDRNENYEKVTQIYSNHSKIRWDVIGTNNNDGWKYGRTDDEGQFREGQTYFIFPDFKTAFEGTFEDNRLVSGVESKVTYFRCANGIMELKFSKAKPSSPIYRYFERTEKVLTDNHRLRDPLERKNVYISNCTTMPQISHQDALYARRDIPENSVIAYYCGVIVNSLQFGFHPNLTIDEKEDNHKNFMSLNDTHFMDVPPLMSDIQDYRSTLGHKSNHHFLEFNAIFAAATHPVYGLIKSLESLRYIKKGEEILTNYGYDIEAPLVPRWYKALYAKVYPSKGKD